MTRNQHALRSARDDALDRLHRITTGLAVGGVAATAGFGALAAATFSGTPQDGAQAAVVDQAPADSGSGSSATATGRHERSSDGESSNDDRDGERDDDEGDAQGGQAFGLTNPFPAPSSPPLARPATPPAAAPPTRAHVSTGGSG
jgi:hypothetical protein